MNKLTEAATGSTIPEISKNGKSEETNVEVEKSEEDKKALIPLSLSSGGSEMEGKKSPKNENAKNDILRFTMLFNKYNSDLDGKKSSKCDDEEGKPKKEIKRAMFFNKEVTICTRIENYTSTKGVETKKSINVEKNSMRSSSSKSSPGYCHNTEFGKPQISEPSMIFSNSLSPPDPAVFDRRPQKNASVRNRDFENLRRFLCKRNSKCENESVPQVNVHPATRTELRIHNSLTSLTKNNKIGLRGALKSKIPSLTAIDPNAVTSASATQGGGFTRGSYWDHWDDLVLTQSDVEKRLNLQISKSCSDNNRRSFSRFKKEDAASVSDSKLLYTDCETKKQIKKCDKKSRGDSSKKEKENGGRKQVQWKTEVDVIYFSTHLAANGDRTGEVVERVVEPLREEWEQQRKGFYAKMVPYQMERHLKDRFISLLKI